MKRFISNLIIFVMFSVVTILMIKKYRANQKNILLHGSYADPRMKYILLQTIRTDTVLSKMGKGRSEFFRHSCAYTNCIVTDNERVLGGTAAFDAVIFEPLFLAMYGRLKKRLPFQKFVFASIESSMNLPMCFYNLNGYFNWTWTYRLDSDIRWAYIAIKDSNGIIVGPNIDMHWIEWKNMDRVNETMKDQLRSKDRAVAWFSSNCYTKSRRENYVSKLLRELKDKYDLDIDVYGDCGRFKCSLNDCGNIISNHYYFFLSFENAFSEDYVTEKLLYAVQNNAVPIVYGGANYSRFLPGRSYINARNFNVAKLAQLIDHLIKEPEEYMEFFRWKKYYSYHKATDLKETNEYCKMCEALNDDNLVKTRSQYNEFLLC